MGKQGITEKILRYLAHNTDGAHTSEIAQAIGHNRITVGKYLDILLAKGQVAIRKIGQAKVFFPFEKKKPKVLVVDDEPHVVNLIQLTLRENEYDVVTAHDGLQALNQVAAERPDVIVLDLMMPNMNGYEVCQKLKENVLTQHIPIIILSAKSQVSDKIKGMKIGADDYLTKPFDPLELEARIGAMIKKEQLSRHQHPLTRLPDVMQTEKQLASRKGNVLCITIENLDDYFAVCGYKTGGEGIALVGKFVLDAVQEAGDIEDLVGHLSYDTLVVHSAHIKEIQKRLDGFDKILPYIYANHTIKGGTVQKEGKRYKVLSLVMEQQDIS